MDITDWNNDEILRLVMAKGHITQKMLLEDLKKIMAKKYPKVRFLVKLGETL